jgi:GMP synthase (glutamine-hydrolysing)
MVVRLQTVKPKQTVLVVQHMECEGPGALGDALCVAGVEIVISRAFADEPAPTAISEYAGLVVMGGPMGVYQRDKYPFLADELRLIESALSAGVPIMGICLGSQLVAAALGAEVKPAAQREIGWHPVSLTRAAASDPLWHDIPAPFVPLHWHGDIFDLPNDAVCLASSDMTSCQCFRFGANVYGCLFHMEMGVEMIQDWTSAFSGEIAEANVDAARLIGESVPRLLELRRIREPVFERWVGLIAGQE